MAKITVKKTINSISPKNRQQWRKWLQANHDKKESVWLIYHKKSSKTPSMSWSDAVEEALCFGWIDSKRQAVDATTFRQFFSKRKARSLWSGINKAKVQQLISGGLMTRLGFEAIENAKKNGSWTTLDEVEKLTIPADLDIAFRKIKNAKKYFLSLSRSNKRIMLQWVALAKRPETRQKRIDEIAKLAGQNSKPKQFE
ncbi:MAG TPA: YdeI/OmpD-associated family protein [Cyclobacteriaceae bacterium]|nr:YdeI/OmpD-associated family protein [Cyclobacteriaceae bacterium]